MDAASGSSLSFHTFFSSLGSRYTVGTNVTVLELVVLTQSFLDSVSIPLATFNFDLNLLLTLKYGCSLCAGDRDWRVLAIVMLPGTPGHTL
jgi:hypothetical protein